MTIEDTEFIEEESAQLATEEQNALTDDTAEESDTNQDETTYSEEELDHIADTAIEVLREILGFFEVGDAEIDEYEGDEGELILDVVGGDLAVLIGRRGRTLDALQTMVTTILFKKLGFRYPVNIDVESYKHRQRQKLESLASSAASRAYRQDRDIKLHPMNPYERRIIHMTLRDDNRVETFSEGTDPDRYVVVRPL